MRVLFVFGLLCIATTFAEAHVPYLVEQKSVQDIVTIENPEISRAFYGQMEGFPHTYEIRSESPFLLAVEILLPDVPSSKNNVSGIIIRERPEGGRVEVVARLPASDALWESEYEPFGADTYRVGPSFESEVDPGVYRIEVSTPDNVEKYVLVVGTIEEPGEISYIETILRIAGVKHFFGKSEWRVFESPLVYGPLLVLGVIIVGILFLLKRVRR